MIIDQSVYPDVEPPVELISFADRADYLHRICGAFDFDIFPEETDWETFAGWKDVFDRFTLPDSPGYHAFRHWYGWEPVAVQGSLRTPRWKETDMREGRIDPCEHLV